MDQLTITALRCEKKFDVSQAELLSECGAL
jgi:hypothetical protein